MATSTLGSVAFQGMTDDYAWRIYANAPQTPRPEQAAPPAFPVAEAAQAALSVAEAVVHVVAPHVVAPLVAPPLVVAPAMSESAPAVSALVT